MSEDGDSAAEQPAETDDQDASADEPTTADREDAAKQGPDEGTTDEQAAEERALSVEPEVVEQVANHEEDLAEQVQRLYEEATALAGRVDDLRSELAAREDEIEDLEGRLRRKQADFENYKKRRKREEQKIRDRATEDLVERLLDVRDNLRRAVEEDHDDVEGLREGVKMTLGELDRVLDAENVAPIEPEPGDEVDPQRHEVMMRVDSDRPDGTIADVYEPGYEMADKVLQAAKVAVSDGE